jgi:hypothetical protein
MGGRVIGRLTVTSLHGSVGGRLHWNCECDCGTTTVVSGKSLRRKDTRSCGCLARESARRSRRKPKGYSGATLLYGQYKASAVSRDLEFDLDRGVFEELTSSDCEYCGASPTRVRADNNSKLTVVGKSHSAYVFNGIDRQNNDEGYTVSNCVPCCKTCNWMKRTMNSIEFVEHCKSAATRGGSRGQK